MSNNSISLFHADATSKSHFHAVIGVSLALVLRPHHQLKKVEKSCHRLFIFNYVAGGQSHRSSLNTNHGEKSILFDIISCLYKKKAYLHLVSLSLALVFINYPA